uniref:PAPA-1 domain-containing protein n=1 Tax=Panagrellus redivivus TaxID=6233 RepID=A0A7E4VMJ8_PANRE
MSKYAKKRKHDLDSDTTGGNESSPEKSSKRSRRREASGSPERDDGGGNVESMSIEETNALRAKLGMAPLVEEEAAPTMRESESGGAAEKVVTQDGIEFVHKAAVSVTQTKLSEKLKEKLETHAAKRKVQSKVLKSKGLADSSDEEEGGVESWIEAQRRKAEEKANEYDQLDGEIEQAAVKRPKRAPTAGKRPQRPSEYDALAGMTVGHSKTSFMTGQETILVLDDKNVLDDDGEEVLVNPTLM